MSRWTHITACLSVETFIQDENILEIVDEYLKKAPKITGSEGNADIFVNLQSDYNHHSYINCEKCEHRDSLTIYDGGKYTCKHREEGIDCPEEVYQSCVTISVQGNLRDMTKDITQKEFDEFFAYVDKEYMVRDYALNIED